MQTLESPHSRLLDLHFKPQPHSILRTLHAVHPLYLHSLFFHHPQPPSDSLMKIIISIASSSDFSKLDMFLVAVEKLINTRTTGRNEDLINKSVNQDPKWRTDQNVWELRQQMKNWSTRLWTTIPNEELINKSGNYDYKWSRIVMNLYVEAKWVGENPSCDASLKSPSKHETLIQCWLDVGPPSSTLAQHWNRIDSTVCVIAKFNASVTFIRNSNCHVSASSSNMARK